jgi:hypothetical protein
MSTAYEEKPQASVRHVNANVRQTAINIPLEEHDMTAAQGLSLYSNRVVAALLYYTPTTINQMISWESIQVVRSTV